MTFQWPSWVDPLPFPFPELHNNRYLIMKMLTLSSCPDWSPFSADISVCFVVDGGQIDMKFHPSRGYDRPLLSASPNDNWKTSYRLHQASCIHPAEWTFIYDVSSFMFQTPAMNDHLLQSAMRTVCVTVWMKTNRQLNFSEWWGLMVYVSAVGSQLVSGLAEWASLL